MTPPRTLWAVYGEFALQVTKIYLSRKYIVCDAVIDNDDNREVPPCLSGPFSLRQLMAGKSTYSGPHSVGSVCCKG